MRNEQIKTYALVAYNHVNNTEFSDYHALPQGFKDYVELVYDTYAAVCGHQPSGLSRQLLSLVAVQYKETTWKHQAENL